MEIKSNEKGWRVIVTIEMHSGLLASLGGGMGQREHLLSDQPAFMETFCLASHDRRDITWNEQTHTSFPACFRSTSPILVPDA